MSNQEENRQVIYMTPYPAPALGDGQDDEINLLELWGVLWVKKWFIGGVSLLMTLVAVYVTLYVLPVTFQAQATLIQTGSGNSTMGGLASLASSLPISIGLPDSGENHLMVFLKSTDLQFKLIDKYNLLPRLYKDRWDAEKKGWRVDDPKKMPSAVQAIQTKRLNMFGVSQDKKMNLITITWKDEDPAFAAEMLQRVISELDYYLTHDYVSDARRERAFVEKQLVDSTRELDYWEQQVPTNELTLAKIKREIMAGAEVYAELRKQVELAKFAEEKEVVNFKVLDQPYVPEVRYKPKRSLICALTLMVSFFSAVMIVFVQQAVQSARCKS